jgi:hypothetical protein
VLFVVSFLPYGGFKGMKNKLFLILTVPAIIAVSPVFPASLEDLAGAQRAAALRTAVEPVTEVQTRNPVPKLLPRHSGLQRFITENLNSLGPNILVETLSLYPKPAGQAGVTTHTGPTGSRFPSAWSEAERVGLFNQLVAINTLAGIQYYSESRKAMRVFYETSQIIDNPVNKTPQPDPVYTTVPASLTLYARQRDLTFGENIYRFDYHAGADAIFFVQENLTSMNAGIIPAVGKNKLKTVFAIIDTGDSLLLYAAAMAKTASLPGMSDRIGASFSNRAKAVIKWFAGRADSVFAP